MNRTAVVAMMLTCTLFGAFEAKAACVDFSGTYTVNNGYGPEELVLAQTGCDKIERELTWFYPDGSKRLIQRREITIDGVFHADWEYPSVFTKFYFEGPYLVNVTGNLGPGGTIVESAHRDWALNKDRDLLILVWQYDASGNPVQVKESVAVRNP